MRWDLSHLPASRRCTTTFASKDDLVIAVVICVRDRILAFHGDLLVVVESVGGLRGWADSVVALHRQAPRCTGCCPLGTLSSEPNRHDEIMMGPRAARYRADRAGGPTWRASDEPHVDPGLVLVVLRLDSGGQWISTVRTDEQGFGIARLDSWRARVQRVTIFEKPRAREVVFRPIAVRIVRTRCPSSKLAEAGADAAGLEVELPVPAGRKSRVAVFHIADRLAIGTSAAPSGDTQQHQTLAKWRQERQGEDSTHGQVDKSHPRLAAQSRLPVRRYVLRLLSLQTRTEPPAMSRVTPLIHEE